MSDASSPTLISRHIICCVLGLGISSFIFAETESSNFGVQLGAYRNAESGLVDWKRLSDALPGLLDGLHPCVQDLANAERPLYRFQLGAIMDLNEAYQLCQTLKSHGYDCQPARIAKEQSCIAEAAPKVAAGPTAGAARQTRSRALAPGARIQLGAYRSYSNAVADWERVRAAEPALLEGLTPCIGENPSRLRISPLQHLQLGVLADDEAAAVLCEKLRERRIDCRPVAGHQAQTCLLTAELQPVLLAEPPGQPESAPVPAPVAAPAPIPVPAPSLAPPSEPNLPYSEVEPEMQANLDALPEAVAQGVAMLPREVQQKSLVEFDFDAPPKTTLQIGPDLYFGSKLTFEAEYQDDLDLDGDEDDKLLPVEPDFNFAFSYTPRDDFWAFAEFSLTKRFFLEDPEDRSPQNLRLLLKQVYLIFDEWVPGWSMQLGRQRFTDEREWLFDEKLDGVRLFYRENGFGLELSLTREELFVRDLLNSDGDDPFINNFFALARFASDPDEYLDVYLLVRDDRDHNPRREEDLFFLGLHAQGELAKRTDYWLEAALVGGERRDRDIRGFGVDLGLTHRFKHDWKPTLTLAAAFGSGDKDRSDDVDRDFRQTDLQDNSDRFGGVASFKYYGQVLQPELSNLQIFTLGAGFRPYPRTSFDLVYHNYWQHYADDDLRDTELEVDPDGDHRHLGHGLDFVWGHRRKNMTLKWIIGGFKPGDAFPDDADTAYFGEFKFEIRF